jgi:hypothetical protein
VRNTTRQRRIVKQRTLSLLRPLFRYSVSRDAYVLRVVGAQLGPVLRPGAVSATLDEQRVPHAGRPRRFVRDAAAERDAVDDCDQAQV